MTDLRYRGSESKGESVKHEEETDDLVYRGSRHDPKEKTPDAEDKDTSDLRYRGSDSE
tara:strand:+ start:36569 stop:36742 length:174 start_codon:yes stop_codon:yes gene_type:complete